MHPFAEKVGDAVPSAVSPPRYAPGVELSFVDDNTYVFRTFLRLLVFFVFFYFYRYAGRSYD